MQISNVSQNSDSSHRRFKVPKKQQPNVSFKAAYVPTTEKYAAKNINNVIAEFNEKLLGRILPNAIENANKTIKKVHSQMGVTHPKIKDASDFAKNYNCFILAGGPGSRFKKLSDAVGDINKESYNKICVPFATKKDKAPFSMITPALTLEAIFAAGQKGGKKIGKDYGYQPYTIEEERGNFWHVVKHYMNPKNKIKDTVLISGDNAFDIKASEMLATIVKMKEEGQHLAMFGVKKSPKEVAGRFGVLGVQNAPGAPKNIMSLNSFVEKPHLDLATKMAETSGGINIANTGALVISKEAMTEIVKIARQDEALKRKVDKLIAAQGNKATPAMKRLKETGAGMMSTFSRSEKESDRFDFSTVQNWILNNMYTPEQIKAGKGPIVQMIDSKKWSDVGEPKAMFKMLAGVAKSGKFLKNFPKDVAEEIQAAFKQKADFGKENPVILVTNKYESLKDVPVDSLKNARVVEKTKIVG